MAEEFSLVGRLIRMRTWQVKSRGSQCEQARGKNGWGAGEGSTRILTVRNRGKSYLEAGDGEKVVEKAKPGAMEKRPLRLENQVVGQEVEITRRDPGVRLGL